jgi:hypothetical protein
MEPQLPPLIMGVLLKGADEKDVLEIAKTLKKTSLKNKGYDHIILTDWQSSRRSVDNKLRFDRGLYGSGALLLKTLKEDYGIKIGLNTSISDLTDGGKPGGMYFESVDARTFAEWGVNYIRVDYSHVTDVVKDKNGTGDGVWPTTTPNLNYVGYNKLNGATAVETRPSWTIFILDGGANISDNRLTGLNTNGGMATFTVNVSAEDAGKYMIAFGYNKQRNGNTDRERLIQAVVSNASAGVYDDVYNYEFPRSSRWHNESRVTGIITLKEGTNTITLRNPVTSRETDARERYKAMAVTFDDYSPDTLFAVNDWGRANSSAWADAFAYSARVAADSTDWAAVKAAYNSAITSQNSNIYTDLGPVNTFLTEEQIKTQLSIWSILASPMFLDTTAERLTKYMNLLGNEYMLNILTDSLRFQGKRISMLNNVDVVVKPLNDNKVALLVFNKGIAPAATRINLLDLNHRDSRVTLPVASSYEVTDVWSGRTDNKVPQTFTTPEITADSAALFIVVAIPFGNGT